MYLTHYSSCRDDLLSQFLDWSKKTELNWTKTLSLLNQSLGWQWLIFHTKQNYNQWQRNKLNKHASKLLTRA